MKKIPITIYITIWYAVFMVLVVAILVGIITYTANSNSNEQARDRIEAEVLNLSDTIRFSDDDFVYNENINYLIKGVYLSVYDSDGRILEGVCPILVGNYPKKFRDKQLYRERTDTGDYWYIFDRKFHQNNGDVFWIRGVTKDQTNMGNGTSLLLQLRWLLIGLAIVALAGGLIMARNALRPVRKIIRTVDEIRDDGDLSRRVKPGRRNDEISQMADSFNSMFDSLEKTLENEKQFTSDVSHELRTPLAVIISTSDYALSDESYREDALKTINKEAKRMSSMVSRLLTLSRSDAGRLPLNCEYIDLSELCRNVADQQRILAEEKNIEIHTDIRDGVYALCDEGFMIRALLNLVDNAMNYGVTGEGDYITIGLCSENGMAIITVSDNGPGIEEENLDRIWERFYRVDASRSERGSSGLGLSMVKAIAKNHGGDAVVYSRPGEGATFEISIPKSGGGMQ